MWTVLGGIGAACFFSRFLVQWLASERAGRSVSPHSFWWLSLAGSLLLGGAALAGRELVLLPGFLVTASIYVRNLTLQGSGGSWRMGPLPAALVGLAAAAALIVTGGAVPREDLAASAWLLAVGIIGQAIWSLRFIVQWYFTERRGYSHFPIAFWWITLAGSAFNLIYTASLVSSGGASKLIFFVSYVPTPLYPIRNLLLERRHRRRSAAAARPEAVVTQDA
jgi:lipid-A-disaccharide synthase-like uncharacterized protein